MAVPYARVRAVFGGTILTAQSWSTAINIAGNGGVFPNPVNQAVLDTWIGNRVINVRDWWSVNPGSGKVADLASTATTLNFLRAYYYPANSDVATLQSEAVFGTALAGAGAVSMPPQTAMVVSTRSGTPGRRGRGRMYLPALGPNLATNGRFTTAICDVVANRTAQLLSDFSTSQFAGSDINVIVASTAGAFVVNRVEVDNDVDTQRRRSDKLLFTYKAQGTVAP